MSALFGIKLQRVQFILRQIAKLNSQLYWDLTGCEKEKSFIEDWKQILRSVNGGDGHSLNCYCDKEQQAYQGVLIFEIELESGF